MARKMLLTWSSLVNEGTRFNSRSLLLVIFGLILGFCFAKYYALSTTPTPEDSGDINSDLIDEAGTNIHMKFHQYDYGNNTFTQKLFNEVRILCWVMTTPQNHKSKAIHVKRTWGKRCNKLLFMSTAVSEVKDLETIVLPGKEGRDFLWVKARAAFEYIYKNHLDDADWFFRADDDTYTIMENLRYFLYPYSTETPIHFGCKFKPLTEKGYMTGGAGYVLSKEAVRRFVEKAIPDEKICSKDYRSMDDVAIGICLDNVNVTGGDSRDNQGKGRFFPLTLEQVLTPSTKDREYVYKNSYYKTNESLDCCSDHAIAFHYVSPNQMYVFDYLIYQLRAYGLINAPEPLPERLAVGEM